MENLGKRLSIPSIGFDEVAIQIEIPRIASEAVFFRAILVGSGSCIPIEMPPIS